jgi:hypothetical protein
MQGYRSRYFVEDFVEDRPNRLGVWIKRHGHRNHALNARSKFPLAYCLLRRIGQSRVSTQHLNIFHASIRVDAHLQTHRPADASSLQNQGILCFDLLHYFAFCVLRPCWRQAKDPQKQPPAYRGISHPAFTFCHRAALKQWFGNGFGTTHTIDSSFAALNLQSSNQPSAFFPNQFQ